MAWLSSAGWRTNNLQGDGQRSGPVAAIQGSLQSDDFAGAQLNAGVNYEHDLEKDLVGTTASLRADRFTLGGDVSHDLGRNGGQTQYGLDFQTSMAVRGGTIAFDGRNQGDGMAMIRIDSAHPSDQFEVLVNDMAAGTLGTGDHLAVALPAYRQYDFRIRQTAGELLRFDGSARRIGLYPGNVARLTWSADPVAAMFGRLLLDSGEPVRMGAITVPGGIGETDDNGYFQIDAAIGSQIEVALRDGKSCRVTLPVVRPQNGYAPLGTLVCRLALAPVMISSAAP